MPLQIWKPLHLKQQHSPYMTHKLPGSAIRDLRFCPFEDVLGIGHSKGFSSILVPGRRARLLTLTSHEVAISLTCRFVCLALVLSPDNELIALSSRRGHQQL